MSEPPATDARVDDGDVRGDAAAAPSHPASFDVLGCPKCRWSLGGCQKCRATPHTNRASCPPMSERAGYAKYAASRGIKVARRSRGGEKAGKAKGDAGRKAKKAKRAWSDEDSDEYEEVRKEGEVADDEDWRTTKAVGTIGTGARGGLVSSVEHERAKTPKSPTPEPGIWIEVDCGNAQALVYVMGKNSDNIPVLQWKSGASLRCHPTKNAVVEIWGAEKNVEKAEALVAERIKQHEERKKTLADRPKTPVAAVKRPSLDVMSIVNDIRTQSMREDTRGEPEEASSSLSSAARSAVDAFISKLPDLRMSRQVMYEYTQEALSISKYEAVPEVLVSTLRERIADLATSASTRLTLFYLLDSIVQASRVDARGGSEATHAMYKKALRKHLTDIVKHMIAIVRIDEATEMKGVEVQDGATIGEAHARHRRRAVQKVLSIWEGREVLSETEILIGKQAISKFRHEKVKQQAKEFDRRLQRQPEPAIKVQADGVNADEFDDIAAMLGNQYGGIDVGDIDLSLLRSSVREEVPSPPPSSHPPEENTCMDWEAPPPPLPQGPPPPGQARRQTQESTAQHAFLVAAGEISD